VTAPGSPVVAVFGGGGAKAAAHAGAHRALDEAGLAPAAYVGTSMGAVVAAMFAAGLAAGDVLDRLDGAGPRGAVRAEPLAFLKGLWARNLLKPEPLRTVLEGLLPARRFAELVRPLTVTAVRLDTGALTLFGAQGRDIPLLDALYASCALPLFFPPLRLDGLRYGDGGLRAVVPLELAAAHSPGLVVAVDVGPGFDEPGEGDSGLPPLFEAHNEAIGILMGGQTAAALALWRASAGRPPLCYVRPKIEKGATFKVDQVRRYAEEGYAATRAALAGLISGAG
jgi:NTE family protein